MRYPVVLHKDPDSDYGVTVPDLPGCFSAGATADGALAAVQEAIYCHFEGILIDNEPIPQPRDIESHRNNPEYADGVWAYVDIDLSQLDDKAKRINITVPERILRTVDDYARRHHVSRSGLLVQSVTEYMASRN